MTDPIIPADLARQMMRSGVSSGLRYLGGNVPGKLVDAAMFRPFEVRAPGDMSVPNPRASAASPAAMELGPPEPVADPVALARTQGEKIAEARGRGYTGDQCSKCMSMSMKWAGHCLVCENCGETTGCS